MGKLGRPVTSLYPCLLVLLTLSGCTAIHQQIVAAARQAGDKVVTTPEKVVQESNCAKREQPFVQFESLEILPERVKPGGRVNYRLIYVMCPLKKFSDTAKARVTRNVLFKGEQVAHNVKEIFALKAGRWAVDSFFTLPPESPLGFYALEVGLETASGRSQKKVRSFVVSDEFYLSGQ
jgi:hypothetical protein